MQWATNLTDRSKLQNNAGEYVVATSDGGVLIYANPILNIILLEIIAGELLNL